tara:strand:- start:5520 stop:6341 length:822 start_codon:yes stop_codon:yes gene_type:complete
MKKFLIIGNPVDHSLSPTLHNYWFNKYKIEANYILYGIDETKIKAVVDKIRNKEIKGINVTIPYKQKVIPFLDKLVNDAKETSSVNTIYLNEKNEVIGENTDVYGLQAGYLKEIVDKKKNKKVLILGAGGVSPSVIVSLLKSDILDISLANRTYEKSLFLKKKFSNLKILKWDEIEKNVKDFEIIVNTTSLGLKNGEDFDLIFKKFKENLIYIDLIYNPLETKMIKFFKLNQIKTYNGLDMLIYQGQKSFYLWNKINPEIDEKLINLLEKKIK